MAAFLVHYDLNGEPVLTERPGTLPPRGPETAREASAARTPPRRGEWFLDAVEPRTVVRLFLRPPGQAQADTPAAGKRRAG